MFRICVIVCSILLCMLIHFNIGESKYVGSSACFHCHKEEYAIWKISKHATSFESLTQNDKKKYYCLSCHTTDGAEYLAGFKIENVECEACHGMGENHVRAHTLKDKGLIEESRMKITNAKELCLRCHGGDRSLSLESFNYITKWSKISHGKNTKKP